MLNPVNSVVVSGISPPMIRLVAAPEDGALTSQEMTIVCPDTTPVGTNKKSYATPAATALPRVTVASLVLLL